MKDIFKLHSIDQGFCRVYFTFNNRFYCIQEETKGACLFYVCSGDDDYMEPEYSITRFKRDFLIEVPEGTGELLDAVRSFITDHDQLQGINLTKDQE